MERKKMRGERKSRFGAIIVTLILIILVLISFIGYIFVLKPSMNGYVVNKQIQAKNQAKDEVLNTILYQIQQQGYTQISDVQGNTIILVPYNPQTQVQQIRADIQG
jgi:hypothetical protein